MNALPTAVRRRLYDVRRLVRPQRSLLPPQSAFATDRGRRMWEAWNLAESSDASAPGCRLAYYTMEFEGVRLPGERDWAARWVSLRAASDFAGKRVVELGCNLGLLSCHLLKEGGANAALGLDHDPAILTGANLVASALEVKPAFVVADFDGQACWEDDIVEFRPDIIFALNVLNWVRDKERFLRALALARELVFEGHDTFEIERTRLASVGFTHIRQLETTERARPLIHAVRQ